MPQSNMERGPRDRSRINVHEPYEMYYWTRELGVTEEQLQAAVRAVGASVEAVRAQLNSRRISADV